MKNIAILGSGKTGLSAYKHYSSLGFNVVIWDDNSKVIEKLKDEYNCLSYLKWDYENLDFIISSPGIALEYPKKHYVLEKSQNFGVKIYCDVELFIQENPQVKFIAVTGTNGKSTVTALINHIFNECGKKCTYAGNIGTPVFDIDAKNYEYIVLELSSYQIDLMNNIHFNCSLLLNIQEDHIDHHGTFENYKAVKYRIFENQTEKDVAIIDESLLNSSLSQSKSQKILIGKDIILSDTSIKYEDKNIIIYSDLVYLKGEHNYKNISFAYVVSKFYNLPEKEVLKSIISFKGLKHRQNNLGDINGITFINDSKATNQESTLQALKAYSSEYDNVYIILGGIAKSDNLDVILPYLKNAKGIFLIGSSSPVFSKVLKDNNINFEVNETIDIATKNAYYKALKLQEINKNNENSQKYIVLLSPACASFDQFKSFEERGDVFVELVKNLQ